MNLLTPTALLALMPPPSQPGQQSAPWWMSMAPMLFILVIFYFALIRPQQKRARDQAQMLKSVRPGDKIVTSGGIVGVVITVKEKTLSIRSADAKMEITKSAVAEIT